MAILAIVLLWAAFAATHMGLSSLRLRPRLVSALGAQGFQAAYSLLALGIFVPLVWLYFSHQHAGPHLWYLGYLKPVRWIAYLGMALALGLIAGGLLTPSPASLTGGAASEPRGVLRITRHPLLMGFGLFGLVHLLTANVNAAELAFFVGFPLFVVLGCRHQDQRKMAGDPSYAHFVAQTGFLPFSAPGALRGLREALVPLALGVGLAVLLRYFHPGWFGGAP
jgi:uncharacterized membrane protein